MQELKVFLQRKEVLLWRHNFLLHTFGKNLVSGVSGFSVDVVMGFLVCLVKAYFMLLMHTLCS